MSFLCASSFSVVIQTTEGRKNPANTSRGPQSLWKMKWMSSRSFITLRSILDDKKRMKTHNSIRTLWDSVYSVVIKLHPDGNL